MLTAEHILHGDSDGPRTRTFGDAAENGIFQNRPRILNTGKSSYVNLVTRLETRLLCRLDIEIAGIIRQSEAQYNSSRPFTPRHPPVFKGCTRVIQLSLSDV